MFPPKVRDDRVGTDLSRVRILHGRYRALQLCVHLISWSIVALVEGFPATRPATLSIFDSSRVHPLTATISEWPDKKHLDAITNLHGSVVRSDLSLAPRFRPCSTTGHRDHQKGNDKPPRTTFHREKIASQKSGFLAPVEPVPRMFPT